jgi:beta-glucosidase
MEHRMKTLTTANDAVYLDAERTIDERVEDLIGRMTRAEKIAQLGSTWSFSLLRDGTLDPERCDDLLSEGIGQVTRVAGATNLCPAEVARTNNAIQRHLRTATRLGIPALVHEEVCSGLMARDATIYPQAIGVASTWEPEYNRRLADLVRRQMRATGSHQGLSPVLDVVRDPRWGRTEETYGEDPYLVARMGVAFVHGLQGEDWGRGVVATAKHFVGYGASEGGLNWAPAHLPPRELREVYLYPFEVAVREGRLASVMNAYHELDGIPCGASEELLSGVLRDEWGFSGTVVSDYFSVEQLYSYHRLVRDRSEAASTALSAGIDVELPATDAYADPLAAALEDGRVDPDVLDAAVRRVLRQKFELGLFDAPYVDEDSDMSARTEDETALALEVARRSLVLLANEGSTLPLPTGQGGTVALIGPSANDARHLLGDYTFAAHIETLLDARERGSLLGGMPDIPDDLTLDASLDGMTTIREELTARLGDRLLYARGCGIDDPSTQGFAEAVALAEQAETVILVLGDKSGLTPECTTGESRDRSSLDLPGVQEQLVQAIAATGKRMIAVLVGGRPMGSAAMHASCDAVLMAWLPGQVGARAIAEALVGEVSPSGKLPISYPRSAGQIPVYYAHKLSGGRSHWHGDYVDSPATPLYAFGHGLSYASFELREAKLEARSVPVGGSFTIDAEIANIGDRAAEEVVQVYIRDPEASVTRPVRELKGFARVAVEPGSSTAVRFTLDTGQLGFYDRNMTYTVEPGTVEIHVGFASDRLVHVGDIVIQSAGGGPVEKKYASSVRRS